MSSLICWHLLALLHTILFIKLTDRSLDVILKTFEFESVFVIKFFFFNVNFAFSNEVLYVGFSRLKINLIHKTGDKTAYQRECHSNSAYRYHRLLLHTYLFIYFLFCTNPTICCCVFGGRRRINRFICAIRYYYDLKRFSGINGEPLSWLRQIAEKKTTHCNKFNIL